jgi:hypothetical protein
MLSHCAELSSDHAARAPRGSWVWSLQPSLLGIAGDHWKVNDFFFCIIPGEGPKQRVAERLGRQVENALIGAAWRFLTKVV